MSGGKVIQCGTGKHGPSGSETEKEPGNERSSTEATINFGSLGSTNLCELGT